MFRWFRKTLPINAFYVLLVKMLHLQKNARYTYTRMLEFTFSREDVIDKKVDGWAGGIIRNKKEGRWNI